MSLEVTNVTEMKKMIAEIKLGFEQASEVLLF